MNRTHILTAALVAAFAVSVVVVASASAVEFLLALWLDGGTLVSTGLVVENEGELELVKLNVGGLGIRVKVLCSGTLDGWVGPESLGFISELLTLAGGGIGTALLCANDENCTEPELLPANLGWGTEVELMVDGAETFFVELMLNLGWHLQCLMLGITSSETCEAAEIVGKLTNEANGTVDEELSDGFQTLAGLKLINCSTSTEETEINGLIRIVESGVTLVVSSE
jgi:hypothetical protein